MMYIESKNSNNIKEDSHGMKKLHKSPYFRGLKVWGTLPDNIQKAENKEMFKNRVKTIII